MGKKDKVIDHLIERLVKGEEKRTLMRQNIDLLEQRVTEERTMKRDLIRQVEQLEESARRSEAVADKLREQIETMGIASRSSADAESMRDRLKMAERALAHVLHGANGDPPTGRIPLIKLLRAINPDLHLQQAKQQVEGSALFGLLQQQSTEALLRADLEAVTEQRDEALARAEKAEEVANTTIDDSHEVVAERTRAFIQQRDVLFRRERAAATRAAVAENNYRHLNELLDQQREVIEDLRRQVAQLGG